MQKWAFCSFSSQAYEFERENCPKNGQTCRLNLEAQQRYFSYRAIFVATVSRKYVVLVFMGCRTIIAGYVAAWGIAQMCLCETKYQAFFQKPKEESEPLEPFFRNRNSFPLLVIACSWLLFPQQWSVDVVAVRCPKLRAEKVFPRICLPKFWAMFGWTFWVNSY